MSCGACSVPDGSLPDSDDEDDLLAVVARSYWTAAAGDDGRGCSAGAGRVRPTLPAARPGRAQSSEPVARDASWTPAATLRAVGQGPGNTSATVRTELRGTRPAGHLLHLRRPGTRRSRAGRRPPPAAVRGVGPATGSGVPPPPAVAGPRRHSGPRRAAAPGRRRRTPVVLVGFSGVRWSDVSTTATPALASMTSGPSARSPSAASSRPPARRRVARPVRRPAGDRLRRDGPRARGRGVRTGRRPRGRGAARLHPVPADRRGRDLRRRAGDPGTGPGRRRCDDAVDRARAGIALARTDGSLGDHLSLSSGEYTAPAVVGEDVQRALESGTDVVVVDAGTVRDPADLPARESAPTTSRATQVAAVDAVVAAVQQAVDDSTGAEATTVLAVSLADSGRPPTCSTRPRPDHDPPPAPAPTRPAGTTGDCSVPAPPGAGHRPDHRPDPHRAGPGPRLRPRDRRPGGGAGHEHRRRPVRAQRREKVEDLDAAAQAVQPLVAPFFVLWGATQLVLYAVGALALRRGWGGSAGRRRILRGLRTVAVLYGSVGASTFLANTIPWWRRAARWARTCWR